MDRSAIAAATQTQMRSGARHFVVQFDRPLSDDHRRAFETAGYNLLSYLGDCAYFASPRENANGDALAAVPSVLTVLPVQAYWKLHPALNRGELPSWAIVPADQSDPREAETAAKDGTAGNVKTGAAPQGRTVALYVMFHSDVKLEPAGVQLALRHGAKIRSALEIANTLVIEMPEANIQGLAGEDEVMWLEPPLPKFNELNAENRARTGADIVQAPPYGLNGAGVSVLVYDGGKVRTTHVDFQGRAVVGPTDTSSVSDHATHVAGTIGGAGVAVANNRGMAPGVSIVSYGFEQPGGLQQGFLYTDPGDMVADYTAAINNFSADISNNSIGTNTAPNGFPCDWEGNYGVTDTVIDNIVRGSVSGGTPFRIVWANGNERQTTRCGTTYRTTAPPACAKNHITVGALNANDDSITSFTSWGPADDGRMKPDISAPGCQSNGDNGVTSCSSSSDTAYSVKCGTSMASPTVCGVSALLLQDFRVQFPARPDPRNSTLKILLAHTAADLGNAGPDNQFGYGSVRIQPAIDFMRSGNFLENQVSQGGSYQTLVIVNPGATEMKVTLAWDDPPGTPVVNPALVNDLDLVVFDPGNNQLFPWTLDLNNPGNPAVRTQKNGVDNIEQVFLANPTPGVYRVEVRGFNVPQGPQAFSLCASPELVNCSRVGVIGLDRVKYSCNSTQATIQVVDCDLNTDNNLIETTNVTIASSTQPGGLVVTLTETGAQTAVFRGTVPLSLMPGPGVLQISAGDTITATYLDADDGQGGMNITRTATSTVDCTPPVVSNVQVTNITATKATVTFNTNEPASGAVRYGTSCGSLTGNASGAGVPTSHSIQITGLSPSTSYFFAIDVTDEAANSATDDNGGSCYTFMTPQIPNRFTENFTTHPNDMANRTLLFVPSGSIDEYAACGYPVVAFPTDPAGGTTVSITDDGSATVNLTGGQTVKLYGVAYPTVYINANGNLTFTATDGTYTQDLPTHFNKPRVTAILRDLNPGVGGTVSWKQLADRFVVTFQNVPTYNVSGSQNSFQYELYFDGRIQVTWLNLSATDGITGLSKGGGLPADFFESDLSAFGACGPLPPVASGASAATPVNIPVNITLPSADPNGDTLTTIIVSLPANGKLKDPNGGNINGVPYTLLGGANVVQYKPNAWYNGPDSFTYKANDGTFDSNIGTVNVTVGGPQVIYSYPMDTDPGWTTMGQWAFGPPTGTCGDPSAGYTGANVYGYNLAGCYPNSLTPTQYLTTAAINCAGVTSVQLRFRRWLAIESATYDQANIQVSTNGTTWTTVWAHSGATLNESAWSLQTYDLSATADNQPTVYLRWGLGPTDGSVTYEGWNIDDVEIIGQVPLPCGGTLLGDVDQNGVVDGRDVQMFVTVLFNPGGATSAQLCAADASLNGTVDADDATPFASILVGE